jgi:hypothetical protein
MKHLIASPLRLALALAACGLCSAAHAAQRLAAPPEFLSAPAAAGNVSWQAVDDDVLSHQTGKAPGAEMVSGLVLDLMSQWQMPNGAAATAHGRLTVTTLPDNTLSAQVSTSAQANDGVAHGNGNHYGNVSSSAGASAGTGANAQASATGGQNVSINGVSQVTQVAGNSNIGMNSAVIDFDGPGASAIGTGGAAGTNSNSASASATSASGSVNASVTFGNGGVALSLQTPAGIARQTIATAGAQGSGSIAQSIQVAGNAQAVLNQLQLSVQTHAMSGALLRQLGVLQAMQNAALGRR